MQSTLLARLLAAALCVASLANLQGSQGQEGAKVKALEDEFLAARRGPGSTGRSGVVPDSGAALERAREQATWATAFLPKVKAIDTSSLTHDEWITHGLLTLETRLLLNNDRFFWHAFDVTPYSSSLRTFTTRFSSMPLGTSDQRLAYLDAVHQVPALMAAYEARLRSQLARGIAVPAPELELVVPYVRNLVADLPSSGLAVTPARLKGVAPAEADAFRLKADAAMREVVAPAVERLAAFIDGPYRAKAPAGVGVSQFPDGREYYQHLILRYTGLELTPEEIHKIGLDEVARLNGELDKTRIAVGFQGTLAEFRRYLKTDRRFFPKTSEEIGDAMMAAIRRIEPKVDAFFLAKPKAPYGVLRLGAELEASMTYGYYQTPSAGEPRGLYRFNGYKPEERSLIMAAATIYHELIPGHHFQIMLRNENSKLTGLRRSVTYTPFTEGWAEYSSDLAGEMGMFDDPIAKAGRIAMDLFLSTRLVVDPGMNALGWSRDRAMQFMSENTLESDLQISTESLRYSSDMPGQALAYKLGALGIHAARKRAQTALGSAFDIRAFHAYLLDAGSMPLTVLEGHGACFVKEVHKQ